MLPLLAIYFLCIGYGCDLVFQNGAKYLQNPVVIVINITCKFDIFINEQYTGYITMDSFMVRETSIYRWSTFCTVNCRLSVKTYQLFHIGSGV